MTRSPILFSFLLYSFDWDGCKIPPPPPRFSMVTAQPNFNADPDSSFHFNADPDPTICLNVDSDLDPAPHQSDANLRPLVYRFSKAPFWASAPPLWAFTTLNGSIFEPLKLLNFDNADPVMQIWIQLSKKMRILADPDPQNCPLLPRVRATCLKWY